MPGLTLRRRKMADQPKWWWWTPACLLACPSVGGDSAARDSLPGLDCPSPAAVAPPCESASG